VLQGVECVAQWEECLLSLGFNPGTKTKISMSLCMQAYNLKHCLKLWFISGKGRKRDNQGWIHMGLQLYL
jgi:hypothetical protein